MEIKEIHKKKTEVITDVICDCCGVSCKVNSGTIANGIRIDDGEMYYQFSYMDLKVNWGYHSGKDTETWTAQVCEKCVDEKMPFINFKKVNYM